MELSGVPLPVMNWESANLPEAWRKFTEHCDLIFKGPLKEKEESVHISYMLLWIGEKGRELHGTLNLSTSERKKLAAIYEKIRAHLQPKINHVFARYKFNNETQGDRTFEQFLTKLRVIAESCNYAESNEMIRDRLVFGVKSPKIREKLISAGDDLTLDKAIEICQSFEYTQEQLREMNKQIPAGASNVDSVKSRDNPEHRRKRDPSRRKRDDKRRQQDRQPCGNCGYTHAKGQCPAKGKQCDKCKKWNHFAKKCRSEPPVNEITERQDFCIDSVRHNVNMKDNQAYVEFEVGSHPIQFKLDTGSQVNILPSSIYDTLGRTEPLQNSPGHLTAYNGGSLKTIGYCSMPCSYRSQTHDLNFYVVQTNSKPILSLKACIDFGLIKLVYSVDDNDSGS